MMAGVIFLEENGYEVKVPNKKLYRLALTIVNKKPTPTIHRITRILEKYTEEVNIRPESGYNTIFRRLNSKIKKRKKK